MFASISDRETATSEAVRVSREAANSGLVHLETSGTPVSIEFDTRGARLHRMRKSVLTAARLINSSIPPRWRCAFVTLTYRPDDEYSPRHISQFVRHLRQWAKRRGVFGLKTVWVMELTKRGVPHYHVLVWLPRHLSLPKPDKQGWWVHGFSNLQWARNAVGYIAKYVSKGRCDAYVDMPFPKGARMHGAGGLTSSQSDERRWWLAPSWVRAHWPDFAASVRPCRSGGGWYSRATGERISSPWIVLGVRFGVVSLMKVADFSKSLASSLVPQIPVISCL